IKIGGTGAFKCRLAVTGVIGDTHSKSCNAASCVPDAVTTVENAVLKFKPIIEGVSFSRSQIKGVTYTGGPNSQGIWEDATTDVESTVVAAVTTSTNKEIYCALKIKPVGVAFRVAAQRAGSCELFKSLREY